MCPSTKHTRHPSGCSLGRALAQPTQLGTAHEHEVVPQSRHRHKNCNHNLCAPACSRTPVASYATISVTTRARANMVLLVPSRSPKAVVSPTTLAVWELGIPPGEIASSQSSCLPWCHCTSGFATCTHNTQVCVSDIYLWVVALQARAHSSLPARGTRYVTVPTAHCACPHWGSPQGKPVTNRTCARTHDNSAANRQGLKNSPVRPW